MNQAPPPEPFDPPASIDKAVTEFMDVIHQVRELRRDLVSLATSLGSVAHNVNRLANEQTVDRLQLGRIEKLLTEIRAAQMRQELKP